MLSVILLTIFCQPVGWSKDCICTSSSLTTPPTPSLMKPLRTSALFMRPGPDEPVAGDARKLDGRLVTAPQHCTEPAMVEGATSGAAVIDSPRRVAPIASISSMNAIAPPSASAALRASLKNLRIFIAVAPYIIDWNAVADTNRKGTPASAAIAFAV